MNDERDFAFVERLTRTEESLGQINKIVGNHDMLITKINGDIHELIIQIKQIKNAIWAVAIALATQIPGLAIALKDLKSILGL